MKRWKPLFLHILLLAVTGNAMSQVLLTKNQALEDLRWLKFSLEYVHPRLYKYDNKSTVDARFDSVYRHLPENISGLDFLSLVTSLNASVHCGHLYTIPQDKLSHEVLNKKVLPFQVRIVNGKLYTQYNYSKLPIKPGSQILSINGNTDSLILNKILPGIAADGYIQTRKTKLAERYFNYTFQGFDLYYQLFVDRNESFRIEYSEYKTNNKKTTTLQGISIEERKMLLLNNGVDERSWFKSPSPKFEIDKQKDFAVLTVSRSFYDKNIDPDFDSSLSTAFEVIREKKINNLILDIRHNEGGSEHQQMELMSYLYDQPFKLYQNIYLSHLDFRPLQGIIIERDSSSLVFNNDDEYMRKIKDDLWINNYDYSENLKLRSPRQTVFSGNLYVLINGASFSSAADLASDLKRTTNAIFIGEETGGTYEGPTGGENIVIQLPNSKIMVRISPNIHIGYMYKKHLIGRGVIPTYQIDYTIEDIINGKDLELNFAKKLIQDNKERN